MAYDVFVCHSYEHRDIYFDLIQKLNDASRFAWRNLSVQYDMRFGIGDQDIDNEKLRAEITTRIEQADIFLVLTKPIASRRRWMQFEILLAKDLGKPIVGIARRRNDRVSSFVRSHAIDIVDTWRIEHIANAIRKYGDNYGSLGKSRRSSQVSVSLPEELPDVSVAPEPSPISPEELDEREARTKTPRPPREVLYRAIRDNIDFPVPRPHSDGPVWWRSPERKS